MKMKTFVLAPDSFKESMTAKEVCVSMEAGLKQQFPDAKFVHVPMADGGEGTMQSLVDATDGRVVELDVKDPLGRTVTAQYGILGDGRTGVVEMASASGIHLVSPEERNPLLTSTYGTGQLIKACLDEGVSKIIVGIGGSATNDGGSGMARALGARFLAKDGHEVPQGGGYLSEVATIDVSELDPRLKETVLMVACDVTNPLCGADGASAVFGPQKGATPEMVQQLDASLAHYAELIKTQLGVDVKDVPGAGAAGGLGAGLLAFTNSTLKRGIEIVIQFTGLEEYIKKADYVFTGEGGMDFQTKFGKTPYGVAKVSQKHGKKVIGLAGNIGQGIEELYDEGFTSIFGIVPGIVGLEQALKEGPKNVERTCQNIAQLLA
ncbi:glycerate kinase [Vagococcus zengguangii]|uniref:Glycerate kinase n=2 Tax=Vagococcus zengguangii TaxID=2571750 RepID=A0A4D7CRA8_9ENTE|nr:glycerate kinase [Vagococcus zengguangii]